jgi:2-iminobutanoate/2-iminopropanoate deaminase
MKQPTNRRKMMNAAAMLLAGSAGAAGGASAQTAPNKSNWTPKKAHIGGVVRSGNLLFLSGIGGWYPERRPQAGDIQQQTSDALTIMKESLAKAGSSMDNVLKVTVALVDPEKNWEPMNETYNTFFPKAKPVRSYFGSTGFRRAGQLLQIDCIAYVD